MVAGIERRRSLREVEDRIEVARRLQRLDRQHGQVLRDVVAEDRTEDADVVAAAVAHAQHGLLGDAIGQAQARRQRGERAFDVEIEADALAAGDQHLAGVDVDEAALARAGHRLRAIDLPAQAVVDRQLARRLPLILTVEEQAVLPLLGVRDAADIALEDADVAEQERRQRRAAAGRSLRARRVELQFARAMPVARNPQVHRVPDIGAELDGVIALELRPVVDELELPLVLTQRTVAARELQRVAEVELVARIAARAIAVEEKRRHAPAEIIDVQSGNARIGRGVRIAAARIDVDAIAEPAESHVGQQRRAQRVIESRGDALVARPRDARERRRLVEAAAADQLAEDARRVHPVVGDAVPAEDVRRCH